jgi:hypothetical protein
MFSFASLGHAIASGMENIAKGVSWLVTEGEKVASSAETVESITSVVAQFVPQAGLALTLEKLGYGALGVVIAGLQSGDAAFKQNLLNAGADESFIQQIEAVIEAFPSVIAGAKAAFNAQTPATTAAAAKASLASVAVKALKAPAPAPPAPAVHAGQPVAATSAAVK